MKRLCLVLLIAVTGLVGLAGCAGTWVVDSQVRTFTRPPGVDPAAPYRFERLPSQQADAVVQGRIEAMAAAALAKAGLRHDEAAARYSVQAGAQVAATLSPWADPWRYPPGWFPGQAAARWDLGVAAGRGWAGYGWYGPVFPEPANPWYERRVSLVLRELGSGQVVYETSARNDGPYGSDDAILGVLFEAALQGFPNPSQAERRVDLPLSPKKP
ncbi:MAG: DUF4136 domain-containing protein [Comamonadaceae bacterium]|nr:MAG: DUF4136 domain-containing protein [Comamonadaceae bacterium]